MLSRFLLTTMSLLLTGLAVAQNSPRVSNAEPAYVLAGEIVSVEGENLSKATVKEVYLTDGKNDTKLATEEQTEKTIKVKLPAQTPLGRFRIMLLTGGATPQLLEQPVGVTVETAQQRQEREALEKEQAAPPPAPAPEPAEAPKPAP